MEIRKIKSKGKKSLNLGDAFPAVLTVALIAILLVAIIYLFTQFQSSIGTPFSYTTINETFTTVNNDGDTAANATNCNFGSFSVVIAILGSNGTVIPSSNYTVNAATGVLTFTAGSPTAFNNSNWNVTYTFKDGGAACRSTGTFTTQFANQIPLIGLILTITLIAIVIAVLIAGFFVRNRI